MTSHTDATITIQDLSGLISKFLGLIITSTILSTLLFTVAAYKLPKKYKAHFVLTIYSKYFQSPLVGDFIPELSEAGETASQRESLIRQILTPEYLDYLGTKYGIYAAQNIHSVSPSWIQTTRDRLKAWCLEHGLYQPANPDSLLSEERQDLRSRIEIFSLNGTTFSVGFLYSDPNVTLQVTKDLYAQVIQSLLELRMHTLVNIRDAILKQLGSLKLEMTTASPAAIPVPSGPQTVQQELKEVRNQLKVLTAEYTEEHPLVQQLRERERILTDRLVATAGDRATSEGKPRVSESGEATHDIYSDLMRKFNYLNIAIESDQAHQADYFALLETPLYPAAPLWPKSGLFALWGMAFGLFGSLFLAALWEYFDRSTLHASSLAQQLGIPLIGELPTLPKKTSLKTPGRG